MASWRVGAPGAQRFAPPAADSPTRDLFAMESRNR